LKIEIRRKNTKTCFLPYQFNFVYTGHKLPDNTVKHLNSVTQLKYKKGPNFYACLISVRHVSQFKKDVVFTTEQNVSIVERITLTVNLFGGYITVTE